MVTFTVCLTIFAGWNGVLNRIKHKNKGIDMHYVNIDKNVIDIQIEYNLVNKQQWTFRSLENTLKFVKYCFIWVYK